MKLKKSKCIIYDKLDFFNILLAIALSKKGYSVFYFSVGKKNIGTNLVEKLCKRYLIQQLSKDKFDSRLLAAASERVLNNIEALYEEISSRALSTKFVTELYGSSLIDVAYKKVIAEEYLLFYNKQLAINLLLEKNKNAQVYFVPDKTYTYLRKMVKSFGGPVLLDSKVQILNYYLHFDLWNELFDKVSCMSLLFLWPFMILSNVKKICFSSVAPQQYHTAIRVYNAGFNLRTQYRTVDFLVDRETLTKENTLFCIENKLDPYFLEDFKKSGYYYVDIVHVLETIDWRFFTKIFLGKVMPAWLKLLSVSLFDPYTITSLDRLMLGLYLRWTAFLEKYSLKNYVTYNDFSFTHIIRNTLLSQRGIRTWYYPHSSNYQMLYNPPDAGKDMRSVNHSYLMYDRFVSWGKKLASFYELNHNLIGQIKNVGCIWSEHIRIIREKSTNAQILTHIKSVNINFCSHEKKIIGVFDTSIGTDCPLGYIDIKAFFDGIIRLSDEHPDFFFVIKPKYALRDRETFQPEMVPIYEQIKAKKNFYIAEDIEDPSWVTALCDLSIVACFTSVLCEAIGCRKKAIFFDATNRFREYYYDKFPNLVAHEYDELNRLAVHWLSAVSNNDFNVYIDTYVKNELDPFADGRAITRFRELLCS